jgi:DNA-directed RNA polymerase subunit RPC12/RpoP
MVLRMVEPNKWYFAVDCSKCGDPIPFLEAPSPEEKSEVKQRTIADLKCPHCGHADTYAPALMSRRQGPEPSR